MPRYRRRRRGEYRLEKVKPAVATVSYTYYGRTYYGRTDYGCTDYGCTYMAREVQARGGREMCLYLLRLYLVTLLRLYLLATTVPGARLLPR